MRARPSAFGGLMDYKEFVDRKTAFDRFVEYRKVTLEAGDKGHFLDAFSELGARALEGDAVAQDAVAYFFNQGYPDALRPNYENYMSWEILAGANGNEFALEKLEFFLKPALYAILDNDELIRTAMMRGNIDKNNAVMVISNLICEATADEMGLNPKNLINIDNPTSLYSPEKARKFSNAMENSFQKVVDYLLS